MTFHEAFPYFAEEFGLHIIGVIEREPGSDPTPEELETTIDQVNQLPVKVLVFCRYTPITIGLSFVTKCIPFPPRSRKSKF